MSLTWLPIAGLVLLGLVLLLLAVRGRYVGDEPRCRRCGYLLTGAHSGTNDDAGPAHCSECGTFLQQWNIVWGKKRVRWRLLVVLCLLPLIATPAQRFFWSLAGGESYQHCPTWILLGFARSNSRPATLELERRLGQDQMSAAQAHDLATVAVEKLSDGEALDTGEWSAIVGILDERQQLTPDQYKSLVPEILIEKLSVRPVIRQRDDLVMDVKLATAVTPPFQYSLWHEPARVNIGEFDVWRGDATDWFVRSPDWSASRPGTIGIRHVVLPATQLPLGRLEFDYTGRNILQGVRRMSITAVPSWITSASSAGNVEVLPADAPDPVAWIDDSGMTRLVQDTMRLVPLSDTKDTFAVEPGVVPTHPWIVPTMMHGFAFFLESEAPLPVNLALEIRVQVGDRELPRDAFRVTNMDRRTPGVDLVFRKGTNVAAGANLYISPEQGVVDNLTIILAASRDVARRTVDLYEIWKGELCFGPFRIR